MPVLWRRLAGESQQKTGPGIPSWNQGGARELHTVLGRLSAVSTSDLMLWGLQLMSGKGTCRRIRYGRKKDTRGHNYSLGQPFQLPSADLHSPLPFYLKQKKMGWKRAEEVREET